MPPKVAPKEYKADSQSQSMYWCHRWENLENGLTGWRDEERQENFLAETVRSWSGALGGDFPFQTDRAAIARLNVNVFLPLCGDTPQIAFLFKSGFNVVGIEFEPTAARRGIEQLAADGVKIESEEQIDGGLKLVGGDDKASNKITIFVGDFFHHGKHNLEANSFDLCYDRGALGALLLELRAPYVEIVNRVMKTSNRNDGLWQFSSKLPATVCSAIVFKSNYRKSANRAAGPPWHLPAETLKELYAGSWRHDVLGVPTEEEIESTAGPAVHGTVIISRP